MPRPFKYARFPGNVRRAFVDPLAAALHAIPSDRSDRTWLAERMPGEGAQEVDLVGPLKLYRASPSSLITNNAITPACRQFGWRVVFSVGDEGLAMVDVAKESRGCTETQIYGDAAADRHLDALRALAQCVGQGARKAVLRDVRVIEMPSIFTTVIWLPGVGIIPLRLGCCPQEEPSVLRPAEFVATVKKLKSVHHRAPLRSGATNSPRGKAHEGK